MTASAARFGETFVPGVACDQVLGTLTDLVSFLTNLVTVDRDGNLTCSARPAPLGISALGGASVRTMAEDPRFVVGSPLLDTIIDTWVLPLVAPILDAEERFAGAMVGAVSLVELSNLLSIDRSDRAIVVSITTPERIVVARSRLAEEWVGRQIPPSTDSDWLLAPGQGIAKLIDFDLVSEEFRLAAPDRERAWGTVELDNGWLVNASIPAEFVLAPARAAQARQIQITFLILLAGTLIAASWYRRIASALRELANGIPMTAEGRRFRCPVGPRRKSRPSSNSSTRRCGAGIARRWPSEPRVTAISPSSKTRSSACWYPRWTVASWRSTRRWSRCLAMSRHRH